MQREQEHQLIGQALLGHAPALDALVAAHAGAAFTLAMRITRSREDAEEVVQDAFVKAFGGLAGFKRESRFATWLYRIVYTTALNRVAARRPAAVELDTLNEASVAVADTSARFEELEQAERAHFTNLALARLAPEERALVTLHYYDDKPLADIAAITRQTPANVKIKLHRARRKLAASLEALLGTELDLWKSRT